MELLIQGETDFKQIGDIIEKSKDVITWLSLFFLLRTYLLRGIYDFLSKYEYLWKCIWFSKALKDDTFLNSHNLFSCIFPSLFFFNDWSTKASCSRGMLNYILNALHCQKIINEVTGSSVSLYSIHWQITNFVKFRWSGLSNFKFKRTPLTFTLGVDQTKHSLKPQNFNLSRRVNFLVVLENLYLEHGCNKNQLVYGFASAPKGNFLIVRWWKVF